MLGFDDISRMWEAHASKLLLILRPHGSWAEDAVQEAFLALAQQEQIPDSPLAWLVTVARNSILQGQRAEHRRTLRQLERELNRDWFTTSEAEGAVDALETTEALRGLPKVQLEIVLLRVWGELSFDEIATVIVPTADPDSVAIQVQSLIGILPPVLGYSVYKTRDAVVACTEPVWTRLQATKAGSHPALSDAMVFEPSSHMALAVSFRQDLRSSAALVWPEQLPNSFPLQLALALDYFQQKYDGFPPRMTVTDDGKPLLSWRVHLLPFIEQQQLYDQFHLDELWSSQHNRSHIENMPAAYENLLHPELEAGMTCIQLPLVEGSFWNGTEQRWLSFTDIPDGTSNTVCFVVAPMEKAVVWTKPEDLQLDTTDIVGSLFVGRDRIHITLFDSSVQEIYSSTTDAILRALLTAAGNEPSVPQF